MLLLSRLETRVAIIILLPAVPVVALYLIFGSNNVFELEGWIKGVVAGGPIAAYVFMVHLYWKIFVDKRLQSHQGDPDLVQLLGEWTYISTSAGSGTEFRGSCSFRLTDRGIAATGSVSMDGSPIGTWTALSVTWLDGNLLMVYRMTETRHGVEETREGVSRLVPNTERSAMDGTWNVLGERGMSGTINYLRAAKPETPGADPA